MVRFQGHLAKKSSDMITGTGKYCYYFLLQMKKTVFQKVGVSRSKVICNSRFCYIAPQNGTFVNLTTLTGARGKQPGVEGAQGIRSKSSIGISVHC